MSRPGREYPPRPIVGVGAVVMSERGVLLIRRGKPPRLGGWSLPGGAQKVGETVYEAAYREVLEETNVEIEVLQLIDVVDSITKDDEGRIQYHYTLVDVVAVADTSQEPVAGGDVMGAEWVAFEHIEALKLWSETERIIKEGHAIWQTTRDS